MNQIKRLGYFCGIGMAILSVAADPVGDVQAALERLGGAGSYTWKSETKTGKGTPPNRQGPIEGVTEGEGATYFRFEMDGNVVETAFLGGHAAIRTETEWESDAELVGEREWIARRLGTFQAPAVEAGDLLTKLGKLKKGRRGVYTGALTPAGVTALLALRSRDSAVATVAPGASGSVTFWLSKGEITKYELEIRGKIMLKDYAQEVLVDRTTTVTISEVGATKVTLPEAAKKKLLERPISPFFPRSSQ
jgi:hypothetical protein